MRINRTNPVGDSARRRPGRPDASKRRCGSVVVELLLIFPILAGFLLGTIEFSLLLYTRQQMLAASREGARVAARGGSDDEVKAAVKQALGTSGAAADNALTTITRTTATPPNTRDQVQVSVQVADTKVVPNLIPFIIDLRNEQLMAFTVMNVE